MKVSEEIENSVRTVHRANPVPTTLVNRYGCSREWSLLCENHMKRIQSWGKLLDSYIQQQVVTCGI